MLWEEELPGGNGGLSLRDVRRSTACARPLERHPESAAAAAAAAAATREQEDWYFAECLGNLEGGRVATPDEQEAFAAYGGSVAAGWRVLGAHKLDMRESDVARFVEMRCPEYAQLMAVPVG